MIAPDIFIPSCKSAWDLSLMIGEILQADHDAKVGYTCTEDGGEIKGAAVNRNICLNMATSKYIVMADDDITGFFPGWAFLMAATLEANPDIVYVSARLMNQDGTPQKVMWFNKDIMSPLVDVMHVPSACVAFRNDGLRFDEEYRGSGVEDTDFRNQLKRKYPNGRIVINNAVKLIHKNEMKNQLGENYRYNKAYYEKKWGERL